MSRTKAPLPAVVSAAGAGRILGGASRQYISRLAMRGELIGTRLDGNGPWVFRKDYIEDVARAQGKTPVEDER